MQFQGYGSDPLVFLKHAAAAAANSLQLCPTLCDPIDGSPPGSPVPGILPARILEWVAISFSNAWKWKVKVKSLSRVRLLATPWTAAYQAPPSMGFSRQEYRSGLPLPSVPINSTYRNHESSQKIIKEDFDNLIYFYILYKYYSFYWFNYLNKHIVNTNSISFYLLIFLLPRDNHWL